MSDLELNTPVHVNRDSGKPLDGVVAFLGKVDFAEGDDWVGIRLTGSSAGQGKNDGSVKGKSYFKSPPNCGLFVREAALEVRNLSKIEELRLRRELASTGIPSAAATTTTTTPAANRSAESSGRTTPAASSSRTSRLEELRQRRAAITPARSGEAGDQEAALNDLKEKLKAKEEELSSIQEKLSSTEEQTKKALDKVLELEQDKEDLEAKLKARPAAAPPAPKEDTTKSTKGEESDFSPAEESLKREKEALEEQLKEFQDKTQALTKQMEKLKAEHGTEITQLRSETSAYKNELQAMTDQTNQRGVSDASHYKEKAQMQAQIAAIRREVQDLKNEKVEMESTLEDLALDKEQLQEEKENLEERLEEFKLDSETAQMEVEELRTELEQARAAADRAGSTAEMNAASEATGGSAESDDMAQALSIQNARLREALIRLREQSSTEKMELTRQLKATEKEIETVKSQLAQNQDLDKAKSKLEEEVRELKDMVEQGSAFEGMVEDLSEKIMEMEEQNVAMASAVRELEEAAELTSEMEEVQAEEIKAMSRDLEDRDTVIRNLEEAIKMQRKREEDFSRTVGNYRTTVETLKKEKEALMEMQQGGEGEKSTLLASSQKALARAAQLVSDSAEMRKKEAQAALDKIEGQTQLSLAARLESLVPRNVAAMEIAAIKGELLVAKVAGLTSGSLDGIAVSFQNNLKETSLEDNSIPSDDAEVSPVALSDETKQGVENMLHQTECSHVLVETASEIIRLLAAGQWPDLLSEQDSLELGSVLGHSMTELEVVLRTMLTSLKKEGIIDTHQSGVDSLRQILKSTKHNIDSELYNDKSTEKSFPRDWQPPGLNLFDQATRAKFACMGAAAAVVAACRNDLVPGAVASGLTALLKKLGPLSAEAAQTSSRLANLDVQNGEVVSKLTLAVTPFQSAADELLVAIRKAMLDDGGIALEGVKACDAAVDEVAKTMSQFSSALRAAKLNADESGWFHPLSPEASDVWHGVSKLARSVRSTDGDEDDVNYLLRAAAIEQRLSEAVSNEPKLSMANAKVASLEKSLATRSKEIAMQNARLSELEKVLAKTSSKPSPASMSTTVKSSEEFNSLKEENRVLMEAMDVLQEQVANYENEIRMMSTMKSPKRAGSRGLEKGATSASKRQLSQRNLGRTSSDDGQGVASSAAVGALEAALFRPALHGARCDAAKWKNKAMSAALLSLPPLSVPGLTDESSKQADMEESKEEASSGDDDAYECLSRLSSALSTYRMEQASFTVVDLEKSKGRSRAQLRASKAPRMAAAEELDAAAAAVKRSLARYGGASVPTTSSSSSQQYLLGKVKLQGKEPYRSITTNVSKDALYRLNLHVLG